MGTSTNILLLTLFMTLIVIECARTGLEVKGTESTGLDPQSPFTSTEKSNSNETMGGLNSVGNPNKFAQEKKGQDLMGGSKKGVESSNLSSSNSSEELGLKDDDKVRTDKDGSVNEGEKKGNLGKGSESRKVHDEGISLPVGKKSSRGEECDPSNSCTDENKTVVACLRVPGDESPDLSLFIQNTGKGPLTVTISAPDFVRVEKTKIQLQEKEDKKVVKVSITRDGTDNLIVLETGNGNCSLDFRNLIPHNSMKETDYTSKSTYINLLQRTPAAAFIFLAALVMASAWLCVSFRRRYFASSGSKYQKLDMELPVSGVSKTEPNLNHEWDNSWGDSWDDEEAPTTPSMPLTPSVSSKGLASRRINKDGWKD
ncbi:uncharacterized protein LOC132308218 [Cornus florida]|uniref:uncharacterized protein LOC132308218 n=1 Tax=Cornus florida TaxID=4283 RepID=UPI00289D2002|nr:uncharacterized protein LOC132308218 [Cornus florida]XP_059662218.1 uncharacterized protein LOC132308218 [Cornus florida]